MLPFACSLISDATSTTSLLDVGGAFWEPAAGDRKGFDAFVQACSGTQLTVHGPAGHLAGLSLSYGGHHDTPLVPAPQPASTPRSVSEPAGFTEPVPCAHGYRFQVDFAGRIWEAAPPSPSATYGGVQFDCTGGSTLVLVDPTHALEITLLAATVDLQRVAGHAMSLGGPLPDGVGLPITCASEVPLVVDALGSLWKPVATPDLAPGATIACRSPASVELSDGNHLILHGLIATGTEVVLERRTAPVSPRPCG